MDNPLPAPQAEVYFQALCRDWQSVEQIRQVVEEMIGIGYDLSGLGRALENLKWNGAIEGRTRLMEPRDRGYVSGKTITEYRLSETGPEPLTFTVSENQPLPSHFVEIIRKKAKPRRWGWPFR